VLMTPLDSNTVASAGSGRVASRNKVQAPLTKCNMAIRIMVKLLFNIAAVLLTAVFVSPVRVIAEHERLHTGMLAVLKAVSALLVLATAICVGAATPAPSTLPVDATAEGATFVLFLIATWLADSSLHRVPRRSNELSSYLEFVAVERHDRQ
jgi:hypothetical protein